MKIKNSGMLFGAVLSALISDTALAQIFIDGGVVEYKVERLEMSRTRAFKCARSEAVWQDADFDQDGVLDDMCIGLEYSPCIGDYDEYVRKLVRKSMMGGCFSLDEKEATRKRAEACNGFSPRPLYCDN